MGIDLMDSRGAPIRAVEDGRINRTKKQSNGALQIVLRGISGSMYYYGHMDDVLVKGGQPVEAGDVIGTMGDTGSPGAVHLHFEFWRSGGESAAVDPAELIKRVCSR
jgi:murein DD-endopeptidase MepM/ murein hydrolase activator NlpD